MGLRDAFARIFGGWFGDAFPPREPPPLDPYDAREHALGAFADYLSALVFAVPKGVARRSFAIPRSRVYTHQPPDPDQLAFPSIAFVPSRGKHDGFRLGPPPEEEGSMDLWAPGTILLQLGEYVETLIVEAWGTNDADRTSVVAGIEQALRIGERSSALLLPLPTYFGRVARFSLEESEHLDDPDVVRGRIRGRTYVRLEVPEVLLVDAVTLRPYLRQNWPTTPIG